MFVSIKYDTYIIILTIWTVTELEQVNIWALIHSSITQSLFYSLMKMTMSWTCSLVGKAWWSQFAAASSVSVQSLRWPSSPSSSSWRMRRWQLWWRKWTSTCWSWLFIGMGNPSARPSPNCSAVTTGMCNITHSPEQSAVMYQILSYGVNKISLFT